MPTRKNEPDKADVGPIPDAFPTDPVPAPTGTAAAKTDSSDDIPDPPSVAQLAGANWAGRQQASYTPPGQPGQQPSFLTHQQNILPVAKGDVPPKPDIVSPALTTDEQKASAKLFMVRLDDGFNTVPPQVVQAVDRYDAQEAYKYGAGIISTPHPIRVDEIQ